MICPNKNSTSYKILEKYYTYQEIYEIFVANEYALPDESEVSSMIKNRSAITMSIDDIESKFNLRNQDGSRKRFLERNYRTTLNKVQQLNKSNPDFNFFLFSIKSKCKLNNSGKCAGRSVCFLPSGTLLIMYSTLGITKLLSYF